MKKILLNLLILLMVSNLFSGTKKGKTKEQEEKVNIEMKGATNIALSIKNAPITTLLKLIAKRAKKNIIIEKSVSGTMTLDLRDIHFENALEMIAKVNGYKIMYSNGTYIIGNPKKLYEGFYEKRYVSFPIKYSDIRNVTKSLKILFPRVTFATDSQKGVISAITTDIEDLQLIKSYINDCETRKQRVINCTLEVVYTTYENEKKSNSQSKSYNFIVNSGSYAKIYTENKKLIDKITTDEEIKLAARLGSNSKIIVDIDMKTKDNFFNKDNDRKGHVYNNTFTVEQNKKERIFINTVMNNSNLRMRKEIFITANEKK